MKVTNPADNLAWPAIWRQLISSVGSQVGTLRRSLVALLLAALMLAGCGEGVIEGLATPFVQQLHPADSGRYLNFTHGFWSLGVVMIVLTAGGMLMLGIS